MVTLISGQYWYVHFQRSELIELQVKCQKGDHERAASVNWVTDKTLAVRALNRLRFPARPGRGVVVLVIKPC